MTVSCFHPFPTLSRNFPIQRPYPVHIYVYIYKIHVYIYVSVRLATRSPVDGRSAYGIKRISRGSWKGGFHHGAPPKAEWSGLSKGCLSYARISEARGISLVLENADALRERGEVCSEEGEEGTWNEGRQEERFRSDEIQYTLTFGGSFALWKVAYFRPYFVSNRIFPLN